MRERFRSRSEAQNGLMFTVGCPYHPSATTRFYFSLNQDWLRGLNDVYFSLFLKSQGCLVPTIPASCLHLVLSRPSSPHSSTPPLAAEAELRRFRDGLIADTAVRDCPTTCCLSRAHHRERAHTSALIQDIPYVSLPLRISANAQAQLRRSRDGLIAETAV